MIIAVKGIEITLICHPQSIIEMFYQKSQGLNIYL